MTLKKRRSRRNLESRHANLAWRGRGGDSKSRETFSSVCLCSCGFHDLPCHLWIYKLHISFKIPDQIPPPPWSLPDYLSQKQSLHLSLPFFWHFSLFSVIVICVTMSSALQCCFPERAGPHLFWFKSVLTPWPWVVLVDSDWMSERPLRRKLW